MKYSLVWLSGLIIGLHTLSAHSERSSLYPVDWKPGFTDNVGRFLHDFSYAGYRYGEEVPPGDGGQPLFDVVADFGANNAGAMDATTAIQQAIDAATPSGGIVYLPAGVYHCADVLRITNSNVILRGAGETETFLYFTSVSPPMGAAHISFTGDVKRSAETPLVEDGQSRTFQVRVADASAFSAGDDVAVGWVITEEFVAEHGMTDTWVVFVGQWKPFFRREVVAIDLTSTPNTITLDVPLRYPAKMRDGASVRHEQGYIRECGIENMAVSNAVDKAAAWSQRQVAVIEMDGAKDGYIHKVHSYQSPAANDTEEKHLQSCGIRVANSKRITVADCRMEKAQHRGEGGNGYLFEVRQSGEVLFRDCVARDGRHNFIQNWDFGATGIVWLRCDSAGSVAVTRWNSLEIGLPAYSEYHHSLAMACLVDSCVFSDGWATGNRGLSSSGAGHTATETVLWNTRGREYACIRSFNYGLGYVIGTDNIEVYVEEDIVLGNLHLGTDPVDFTEFIGRAHQLQPSSLYESQRNKRLGIPEHAGINE